MIWTIFFASFMMGFSGAIMPGPLLTVTINESLHQGPLVGPKIVSGHAVLELFLVVMIFLGMGMFITLPLVKASIGLLGGFFLFWMAYGIIKEATDKTLVLTLNAHQNNKRINPILAGISVSASNPYWSIWWATAGISSLMLAGKSGLLGAASFYSGHILSDLVWYSLVSIAVAKGRQIFTPLVYRSILGFCGVFLFGLAGYFMYSGIDFLFN